MHGKTVMLALLIIDAIVQAGLEVWRDDTMISARGSTPKDAAGRNRHRPA
jgi:hypothetical protein